MTRREIERYKRLLLGEKLRILKQLCFTSKVFLNTQKDLAGDLTAYTSHIADLGTDTFSREIASALSSGETRVLLDIDDALRRMAEGTFGICEQCGQNIGKGRLNAVPYVRLCLTCQQKIEEE